MDSGNFQADIQHSEVMVSLRIRPINLISNKKSNFIVPLKSYKFHWYPADIRFVFMLRNSNYIEQKVKDNEIIPILVHGILTFKLFI